MQNIYFDGDVKASVNVRFKYIDNIDGFYSDGLHVLYNNQITKFACHSLPDVIVYLLYNMHNSYCITAGDFEQNQCVFVVVLRYTFSVCEFLGKFSLLQFTTGSTCMYTCSVISFH